MRKFQVAEYAWTWPFCSALWIASVVCFAPAALAQNVVEVVHTDEATHSALLSAWRDYGDGTTAAQLYRATLESAWSGGQIPPVLREGVTYRGSITLRGDSHDEFRLALGLEVARVFHPDSEDGGNLELGFDNAAAVGEPCSGTWEWNSGKPDCVNVRPRENRLGDAWRRWSDRDKLMLLLYLYDMKADGIPASAFCAASKSAEERHRCQPTIEGKEYLDPIVEVARMVHPSPSLPDRAHEYLLRANSELEAVKSPDDLRRVIVDYDSVVESAPWWGSAYYNRARAEAVAGLYLWAIADYERFLKLNPSPADAQDARARIAQLAGLN